MLRLKINLLCWSDPTIIHCINTYGYVRGNPLTNVDPSGLQAQGLAVLCGPYFWACAGAATAATAIGIQGTLNAITASKPSSSSAANDPSYGGGTCPPNCEELKKTLDSLYFKIVSLTLSRDPATKQEGIILGQQFRNLVSQYNKICKPPYDKDPFLGKADPPVDIDKIHDFYGR
jgi:hypothetical protein